MPKIKVKPGEPPHMDPDDDRTFEEWMQAIDILITRFLGVSVYDLPDCAFADWYTDRIRPIHAANRLLANVDALCEE